MIQSKSICILGGVGPEATSKLYLKIIHKYIKKHKTYPLIIIYNLPFPKQLEQDIILNNKNQKKMLPYILNAINNINADYYILPCNTLHSLYSYFYKTNKHILNIIKLTVAKCKKMNFKKVGIIGTTELLKQKLYQKELKKQKIDFILPKATQQKKISKFIIDILNNNYTKQSIIKMNDFIYNIYKTKNIDGIIIACTDLSGIIQNKKIKIIDSLEESADYIVKCII